MKLQPFAELVQSMNSYSECYKYDGNPEHLRAFLDGTQYAVDKVYKSTAHIKNDKGNIECIFSGTNLIKNINNPAFVCLWDGCYISGYNRKINRPKLLPGDELNGFDVRGWSNGQCLVQLKDETFKLVNKPELGPESTWKDKFLCVVLNKPAWIEFKEAHHIDMDDEFWKPTRPEVEF